MRKLFIVGGQDYNIPKELRKRYEIIGHHKQDHGRSVSVPRNADAVLIIKDWCSHNIFHSARDDADRQSIPLVTVGHGLGPMVNALRRIGLWEDAIVENPPVASTSIFMAGGQLPSQPAQPTSEQAVAPIGDATLELPDAGVPPLPPPLPAPDCNDDLTDDQVLSLSAQVRVAINTLRLGTPFDTTKLYDAVRAGGVAISTEKDKGRIRGALNREVDRGLVHRIGDGLYKIEAFLPVELPRGPVAAYGPAKPTRPRRNTSASAEEIMALADELKNDALALAEKVERFTGLAEGLCARMDKLKALLE